MTQFLIYPAINDDHSFPSEVNQAIAESPEVQAEFMPRGELSTTYVPGFAPSSSIVYDGSGNVTSSTENGITTTYTYNTDGTVNTETRLGKVRTWVYDANGNPTSSTVV